MSNRRTAVAGLCVLAAASLAMTACKSSTTTATPGSPSTSTAGATAAAASLAPADALTAAIGKLKGASYDVTLTDEAGQGHGTGSVDSANSSATLEEKGNIQGQSLDIAATQIATNLWAKIDIGALNAQLGVDPTKWMLLDQSKLTSADAKPFDLTGADAFGVTGKLAAVSSVTATDATHLTGTVDLSKATGIAAPAASDLSTAGAAAAKTPFTATLDDQGRLTDLKINADGFDKDLTEEISFSNYGSPTPITAPPAADVIPAPAAAYQLFNQD